MLTIQPIMNSIDATNGNQSDDFQSSNFNADDEFGDFTDFQDNKIVDDDFGDFTFFQSSTNVNNTSYCNSSNLTTTITSTVTHTVTTTATVTPTLTATTTTNTLNSVNGFRNDNVGLKPLPNYSVINETINGDFGVFSFFQGDNCDNNSKNMDDDEFGDFTFFRDNDKSTLGTNHEVNDKDSNTDGDLNFFSTPDTSENNLAQDKLDQSVGVVESNDSSGNLNAENGDEDDFGDFADFQETTSSEFKTEGLAMDPSTKPLPSIFPSNAVSKSQGMDPETSSVNSPLSSIVCQSFTKDIQNGDNKVISNDLFSHATPQSYKMWQSLINWEEAASLKLNWESSHTFQVFLRSLKIDSRNIQQMHGLRNISTPLIPSKLTILQPTPLTPSIVPLEPQVSQQSHSLTVTSDSLNSLDNNKPQEQSASSIPEASFDWNSSGLTNPLEKDWLILL